MRPLDRVGSIKLKLGIAIVAAVGVAAVTSTVGPWLGVPVWVRPVVAVAISLAMIQVLARGMTSPLREMARAASAMAAGDYGRRVTATSRDEVAERLHQVVANMVDNAARYGPTDQPVRITAQTRDHEVVVVVEDRGPGIPEPDPRRLLEDAG